jgi:UPF0271 protein
MSHTTYTINCDLGEGVFNEASIIPLIDAASIACGGHFGDQETIKQSLTLVRLSEKKAGAHPSYPDKINFGRKTLILPRHELIDSVYQQINLYSEIAASEGMPVDHIKFHGALYNDASVDGELADALVVFLKQSFSDIPILVPPHSEIEKAATRHLHPFRLEIFGDRAYQSNYTLVDRKEVNSLFTRPAQVIDHLETILQLGQIKTYSGELIPIKAHTLCFHGDNPGLMEFLPQVRNRFSTHATL